MAEKWVQAAHLKEGAFSAKAKRAGMTTREYAQSVLKKGSEATPRTKKQAVLARTFRAMSKK